MFLLMALIGVFRDNRARLRLRICAVCAVCAVCVVCVETISEIQNVFIFASGIAIPRMYSHCRRPFK